MSEDDIKQVLTSPSVVSFFRQMFNDKRQLLSIRELASRVGRDRATLRQLMDLWEKSKGAFGLAFIRLTSDADSGHRYTCMSAWDDFVRREELASAQRSELGYRAARYR